MILGRELTAGERAASQRNYIRYCFVNGASYVCLGENVLVLFAAALGVPDAVVALLGAAVYVGFAFLPPGVKVVARRGAALCQADFWMARNFAALFTATAALAAPHSIAAASAILLAGALAFYACRSAGSVLLTPLLGDISASDEAPGVIGRGQAWFNASAVAALAAIGAILARWHGAGAYVAIIVTGALMGMASTSFLRGIRETGAIKDAASTPLRPGMRRAMRSRDLRRLSAAWFLLNLASMMLVPVSTLALKRGCGYTDAQALACAFVQYVSGCAVSFASGPLCRAFGPRRVLVASALGFLAAPFLWFAAPAGAGAPMFGLALFLWLGGIYFLMMNATGSYFLLACPDKADQVPGSVAFYLVSGGGAGLLGSVLSPWLVTRCAEWAPRLGMSAHGGKIGPYRLYFACLVPLMVCSLATALALETKLYEYHGRHGETALRRAVAFGHHRRH